MKTKSQTISLKLGVLNLIVDRSSIRCLRCTKTFLSFTNNRVEMTRQDQALSGVNCGDVVFIKSLTLDDCPQAFSANPCINWVYGVNRFFQATTVEGKRISFRVYSDCVNHKRMFQEIEF